MRSTRSDKSIKASEAIIKGLAEDGGLFIFEHINGSFYSDRFLEMSYQDVALEVMNELLDDYSKNELEEIINSTYSSELFPEGIVDLVSFNDYSYLSLYKGETFSFKDMALSILPKLLFKAKEKQNDSRQTVVLTATSGDTGSATLSGFSKTDAKCIVLYPNQGVSDFQERQMLQYQSAQNKVIAIDGDFDDAQRTVKNIFNTVDTHLHMASANSINIGRIVPQVVYYVYAYSNLANRRFEYGKPMDVIVPTGNFGNIFSCYVAKSLGVPIGKMIIASNSNNTLTNLFRNGIYDINKKLLKTITPSMDIVVSSNLERYLSTILSKDRLLEVMNDLLHNGVCNIPEILESDDFEAYYADEEKTKLAIQNESSLVIDPHTAVAKAVYDELNNDNYTLIVSTASPSKFEETMMNTLGVSSEELKQRMTDYDERIELLNNDFNRITVSNPEDYIKEVLRGLENES